MFKTLTTAAALTAATLLASASTAGSPQPMWITTPCAQEDAANCYWDATVQGNSEGQSFYSVQLKSGKVCTLYWRDKYAAKHNRCR